MKKTILILGLLCLFYSSDAQISLSTNYIKPSGFFGYIYEPNWGIEFGHSPTPIDSRIKMRYGFGYWILKNREPSYPDYGITFLGTTKALPGYQIWSKMECTSISILLDAKLLRSEISPTLGADFALNSFEYEFIRNIPAVRYENYNEITTAFGITPKIGLSIEQNEKWLYLISLGKTFSFDSELGTVQLWRLNIGATHYFNFD